jgi:hypothetical protein
MRSCSVRRGDTTTSQTKGTGGHGTTRGRNERWRCWKIGGGTVRRGDATTSQTRVARGNGMERGMMRGDGAMRGRVAGR